MVAELAQFTAAGEDIDARIAIAENPAWREALKEKYSPDAMTAAGGMLETLKLIRSASPDHAKYDGLTFGELAAAEDKHVIDAFFDLVIAARCDLDFRTMQAISQDVDLFTRMYKHPRVIAGTSDGGAHLKFFCGAQFSTDLIMWLARDERRFRLEEMHHKLSLTPARLMGFQGRGALLQGWAADVMVYDLDELGYPDTYEIVNDLPGGGFRRVTPSTGIEAIVVNGDVTFEQNSACTGATPGLVLTSR